MEEEILSNLGKRVKKFRKQKGWTLETLSDESGLPLSTLSQVERGQRNLTLRNLERISEGLDVDPYQLLLFPEDQWIEVDESKKLSSRELLNGLSKHKRELIFKLSQVLGEWSPERN